jgi:cytochrome P450 monooxygenase
MDAGRDPKQAPSLPGRWPLFGNMLHLRSNGLELLREAKTKLGPVFWVDMGFGHVILMVAAEPGFAVFRNKDTNSSHLEDFGRFLGQSMLVVDGPDHRRMRNASSAPFTPGGLTRARAGELIAETVARHVGAWQGRERVAIVRDTKSIALEVIFRVMDIPVEDLPDWSHWYGEFMLSALNIPLMFPGSPAWRGRRARKWLEARMTKIIEAARARGDHDSLVGAMVHGRDEDGQGMSEQELLDNLLVLGFAGHETTASTMAWSMLRLAHSPEHWQRLCAEATALAEVPNDYAELSRLAPLAVGVFRESLRLYPPVAIDSRRTHTRWEVMGYQIEPGTMVGTSITLLSRDPERYADPDEWRPERWLNLDHKPTPIENCQFGGGPHFCLGYHMALLEGTLFLVHAARSMAAWGVRPIADGPLPKPVYLPFTQAPINTQLRLG